MPKLTRGASPEEGEAPPSVSTDRVDHLRKHTGGGNWVVYSPSMEDELAKLTEQLAELREQLETLKRRYEHHLERA